MGCNDKQYQQGTGKAWRKSVFPGGSNPQFRCLMKIKIKLRIHPDTPVTTYCLQIEEKEGRSYVKREVPTYWRGSGGTHGIFSIFPMKRVFQSRMNLRMCMMSKSCTVKTRPKVKGHPCYQRALPNSIPRMISLTGQSHSINSQMTAIIKWRRHEP